MEATPRWLVGLDLLPQSVGVLRVAEWLRAGAPPAHCVGVHVVETGLLRFVGERTSTILDAARATLEETLRDTDALEAFTALEAIAAPDAEHGLVAAAARHQASGMVLGRWSRRGDTSLIRLGRVARRILRELPVPVIVTPPDLTRRELTGDGPIVLATDLTDASADAARFAVGLASRQGRRLIVVYVAVPITHASLYVLDDEWEVLRRQEEQLVAGRVDAWARAHAPGAEVVIAAGPVAERLLEIQSGRGAVMIVVGSRRLSLAERIFGSSLASGLAAIAPCPVAVVPPPQ